jgi:hypothetical protein
VTASDSGQDRNCTECNVETKFNAKLGYHSYDLVLGVPWSLYRFVVCCVYIAEENAIAYFLFFNHDTRHAYSLEIR